MTQTMLGATRGLPSASMRAITSASFGNTVTVSEIAGDWPSNNAAIADRILCGISLLL
jgi:predicted transcriptional regulator